MIIIKVLVACEFTQTIANAFYEKGHDAYSCDLRETEGFKNRHIQCNVMDIINDNWDLIIAHPPCQYLSSAGNRYFKNNPIRCKKREEAFKFFMRFTDLKCKKVCIENPVGYPNSHYRKPDMIIHPYYFGEPQLKRTCLWLKGLPKLKYEDTIISKPLPTYYRYDGKPIYFTEGNSNEKNRSRTFKSIALAMANQWG